MSDNMCQPCCHPSVCIRVLDCPFFSCVSFSFQSTLLNKFTTTRSESANYEFTTLTCIPGVIEVSCKPLCVGLQDADGGTVDVSPRLSLPTLVLSEMRGNVHDCTGCTYMYMYLLLHPYHLSLYETLL